MKCARWIAALIALAGCSTASADALTPQAAPSSCVTPASIEVNGQIVDLACRATTTTAAATTTSVAESSTTTTLAPTTTPAPTTTAAPTTTTPATTTTAAGSGFTVGTGASAMVFPEKPGLTVPETSLTPYTGPSTVSGAWTQSNCLVTRQIRVTTTGNLKLTNCLIRVNVFDAGYGMIGRNGNIECTHCVFDGTGFNDVAFPIIIQNSGLVRYSEFKGNTDNARFVGDGLQRFEWNWVHAGKPKTVTGGAHSDGIEVYYASPTGGAPSPLVYISNNFFDIAGAEGENSSVNVTADFGDVKNVRIEGNTFKAAGGYALYVRSDGYCACGRASNVQVVNNRWFADADNRWGGYYGAWSINQKSDVSVWTGNTLTRFNGQTITLTLVETQP